MSLISNFMKDYIVLNKRTVPDGEGGVVTEWIEGAPIKAAVVLDSSTLGKIAEAQGVKSLYTVTTAKEVVLEYPDVIKRVEDNMTFQITSIADKASPDIASIDIRQVSARLWEPTT